MFYIVHDVHDVHDTHTHTNTIHYTHDTHDIYTIHTIHTKQTKHTIGVFAFSYVYSDYNLAVPIAIHTLYDLFTIYYTWVQATDDMK